MICYRPFRRLVLVLLAAAVARAVCSLSMSRNVLRRRRDAAGSMTLHRAVTMNGRPGVGRLIGEAIIGVNRRRKNRIRSSTST